mmetsp:Transcript_15567/g.47514  ORF Transcript_15567/g.47514 Transcript_15567/m.47514 type:complete len:179 (+) Transcript_15567:180-716(+)
MAGPWMSGAQLRCLRSDADEVGCPSADHSLLVHFDVGWDPTTHKPFRRMLHRSLRMLQSKNTIVTVQRRGSFRIFALLARDGRPCLHDAQEDDDDVLSGGPGDDDDGAVDKHPYLVLDASSVAGPTPDDDGHHDLLDDGDADGTWARAWHAEDDEVRKANMMPSARTEERPQVLGAST